MKAEELERGDWVMYKNKPTRIKRISESLVDTTDFYEILPSQIDPIPITPEILEKFGFSWNEERHLFESEYFDLRHVINETWAVGDTMARIDCVHKLQHALRLCVNFKEIILNSKEYESRRIIFRHREK